MSAAGKAGEGAAVCLHCDVEDCSLRAAAFSAEEVLREAGEGPSIANRIFLTVTNTSETMFAQELRLFLNPYEDWGEALAVSVSGLWQAEPCLDPAGGQTQWRVWPRNKRYACGPGESFAILIDNIICRGDREKMVCLGLRLEEEGRMGYIPVFQKYHRVLAKRFVCDRNTAGVLDRVTFDWEVLGNCSHTYFLPGHGALGAWRVRAKDKLEQDIYESTDYALLMRREEITAYAKSPVTVLEPAILSFEPEQKSVRYGTTVDLLFVLENTYHGYIDGGIGRVEATAAWQDGRCAITGRCPVTPRRKVNTYRLSILGPNGIYEKTATITIERYLTEVSLSFTRIYENNNEDKKNRYRYDLAWEIANCREIRLTTSDGVERSDGKQQGRLSFWTEQDGKLTLQVELKGDDGQEKCYQKQCN
ncbi:hypothetical protein Sgly_1357 [Syntrophobotulus glycolicus DSM 8271]|uniref:Uncharacterized protein n=1 Tax=Syntrophobotulus glycolicus (strain DSM 8271 / FlGlyR) TaxID=645991 RepID=F0SVV6_SYNGF|nr:hypothetical protein Sgly_1357 [Syntrophobotulus glycolicus DSM 8271]